MSFWSLISFFGVITGIIILTLLFKITKVHKRYVPIIIYVILVLLHLFVLSVTQIDVKDFPHLLYVTEPFSMLYALLIYIYVRNQQKPQLELRRSDLILLIPFILSVLSYLPYFLLSAEDKLADHSSFGSVHQDILENIWEWNFEIIVNSAFLIAALQELKKYNLNIKEQFSDVHKVDLHLTRRVIEVCLAGYALEFIFVYLTFFGFPYYSFLYKVVSAFNFVVLFFIGYDAFISHKHIDELLRSWEEIPESEITLDGQIVKYTKSVLSDDSMEEIKEKLLKYMKESQPFLNSKLRIKDLSDLTNIPSHHISYVINKSFQQNFYEFINHYRVEAAKVLLRDTKFKDYTYTAIGFEVGFNSKSAFYAAFKKNTGTTPAQF